MTARDPRIDPCIAEAAPFAGPILEHVRKVVHHACPDVGEALKWGAPSCVCAGGLLCGMPPFKQHAWSGFRKQALVVGEQRHRHWRYAPR